MKEDNQESMPELDYNVYELAAVAQDEGMFAVGEILYYLRDMLDLALEMVAVVTNREVSEVRLELEKRLGLENHFEMSARRVLASKDMLKSLIDEIEGNDKITLEEWEEGQN